MGEEVTVTQADIDCENDVEWVLHQERAGNFAVGEGVKLARTYIARHRHQPTADLTAQRDALVEALEKIDSETTDMWAAGVANQALAAVKGEGTS